MCLPWARSDVLVPMTARPRAIILEEKKRARKHFKTPKRDDARRLLLLFSKLFNNVTSAVCSVFAQFSYEGL